MTKAKWLGTLAIILMAFLGSLIWKRSTEQPQEAIPAHVLAEEDTIHAVTLEAMAVPQEAVTKPSSPFSSEDVTLLAKIMAAEDGYEWPDWAIMAIGEVVLNRVASVEFPDTIEAVLMQDNPRQYAPVHEGAWSRTAPEEHYIELAERLLDGERVLNNPQIVYQALFEQGRGTVVTYHDFYLGSTTYFCLTDSPGLYP